MFRGEQMSLSGESEINCVSYDDVLEFIQKGGQGTGDAASSSNVRLADLANELKLTPKFGQYVFNGRDFDSPLFSEKTSMEIATEFYKSFYDKER